jgi:hypothetical protein
MSGVSSKDAVLTGGQYGSVLTNAFLGLVADPGVSSRLIPRVDLLFHTSGHPHGRNPYNGRS